MSRSVVCPVSRWAGTVTFAEPMTMPQAMAWERSIRKAQELGTATATEFDAALLDGVFVCVEKWELAGLEDVTPQTFPATPRADSASLISWLVSSVTAIYVGSGEVSDPNG